MAARCKVSREEEVDTEAPVGTISLGDLLAQLQALGGGGWTPKKPDKTVYNFGVDIPTMALPAGQWTRIMKLPKEYAPYIVYWKIVIADTPNIICQTYMEDAPVSPNGIDLRDLYNYGVWQANDRVWCHIYDAVNGIYGLNFNVVEPVLGDYEFLIKNDDTVAHNLTYMYAKWYQWSPSRHVVVGE